MLPGEKMAGEVGHFVWGTMVGHSGLALPAVLCAHKRAGQDAEMPPSPPPILSGEAETTAGVDREELLAAVPEPDAVAGASHASRHELRGGVALRRFLVRV
jgi:hypothetical protein